MFSLNVGVFYCSVYSVIINKFVSMKSTDVKSRFTLKIPLDWYVNSPYDCAVVNKSLKYKFTQAGHYGQE